MANVFFTSDPHFGHPFVAGLRGFDSVAAHDTALFERWAAVVRPADQVWVLGDLALSKLTEALVITAGLPGEKHLILGNHDKAHPVNRDSHKWQRRYLEVFASVQTMARRKIQGKSVMLSHFPYDGDHTVEQRYLQYRLRDEGEWLLHGHTHSALRYDGGRQIHVGLDAWDLTPIPLEVIEKIIMESEPVR